jgi:hypothetical protein
VWHVFQLLLNIILKLEGKQQDNSRLLGSLFIGGIWLLLVANFAQGLTALWRDWLGIGGWFLLGLGAYMYLRRKLWHWKAERAAARNTSINRT